MPENISEEDKLKKLKCFFSPPRERCDRYLNRVKPCSPLQSKYSTDRRAVGVLLSLNRLQTDYVWN